MMGSNEYEDSQDYSADDGFGDESFGLDDENGEELYNDMKDEDYEYDRYEEGDDEDEEYYEDEDDEYYDTEDYDYGEDDRYGDNEYEDKALFNYEDKDDDEDEDFPSYHGSFDDGEEYGEYGDYIDEYDSGYNDFDDGYGVDKDEEMVYVPDLPQLDTTFAVPQESSSVYTKQITNQKLDGSSGNGIPVLAGMSVLVIAFIFVVRRHGAYAYRPKVAKGV